MPGSGHGEDARERALFLPILPGWPARSLFRQPIISGPPTARLPGQAGRFDHLAAAHRATTHEASPIPVTGPEVDEMAAEKIMQNHHRVSRLGCAPPSLSHRSSARWTGAERSSCGQADCGDPGRAPLSLAQPSSARSKSRCRRGDWRNAFSVVCGTRSSTWRRRRFHSRMMRPSCLPAKPRGRVGPGTAIIE